jgi:protein-S-isoprenylcysteine O-methyltransferase Ste14
MVPLWISQWRVETALPGLPPLRFAGGVLLAGAIGLLGSVGRFAIQGAGTPTPVFRPSIWWLPDYIVMFENPMYMAVTSTMLGQGLIFVNVELLEYGALVWLLFHLFVLAYEEPTLRASFGSEYTAYCAEVPRWIPRLPPDKSSLPPELRSARWRDAC